MKGKKYLSNEDVNILIAEIKKGNNVAWEALYKNFEDYVKSRVKDLLTKYNIDDKKSVGFKPDLLQAGWEAFVKSIMSFDPTRGNLSTYATKNIDFRILKELKRQLNHLGLTEMPKGVFVKSKQIDEALQVADNPIELLFAEGEMGDKDYDEMDDVPVGEKYSADRRALQILYILKTLTDEEHSLTKKEIGQLLNLYRIKKYNNGAGIEARNTITSSLENLARELNPPKYTEDNESKYKIIYDGYKKDTLSEKKNGKKKSDVISNFSYRHLFSNAELDLLIEQICFSALISAEEKEKLIMRLVSTASDYYKTQFLRDTKLAFNPKAVYSRLDYRNSKDKRDFSRNIAILQEALNNLGRVRFTFNGYNGEGDLEPTSNYKHELSPYHLVVYHDNFYCIGLKKDDKRVWHYRVDLMTDIEIVRDDGGKIIPIELSAFSGLPIANPSWDPQKYMAEHLYMGYDEPRDIQIKIRSEDYTIIHDWFGKNYKRIKRLTDEGYDIVKVSTSPAMIVHWAMQYAGRVEILDEDIRKRIREEIKKAEKTYEI